MEPFNLGGGRLYFTPKDGTEVEIGNLQSLTISAEKEKATANSYHGKKKTKVAEATLYEEYTLGFGSVDTGATNMAMAVNGEVNTATVAIGDPLPDGTTATAETEVTTIGASTLSQQEGSIRFERSPMLGKNEIWTFFKVSLSADGDISLIGDEFRTINFTATVLADDTITDGSSQFYKIESW